MAHISRKAWRVLCLFLVLLRFLFPIVEFVEGVMLSDAVLEVAFDGSLVSVSVKLPLRGQVGGRRRGVVHSFSAQSRRRLIKLVGRLRRDALPVFVTLTYPAQFPTDCSVYKAHLDSFVKRLRYYFPQASGLWRLEFQARGAPHYHLLVWGVPYPALLAFVSRAWYEVVGSGDERHFRAGTRVECVRNLRMLWSYVSKYVSKVGDDGMIVGRRWGVFARDALPWSWVGVAHISPSLAFSLLRSIRRFLRRSLRCWYSSFILSSDPDRWVCLALSYSADGSLEFV